MSTAAVATDRVLVAFAGEGAGVGELSWGQREIWQAMVNQRSSLAVGGRKPLAAGTTVAEIADELRYLMTRYPTMRTRLRFDRDGRPTQECFASGEVALEIFDVGDDDDPDQVAAAVEARYKTEPFDYVDAWPIRMAVTRRHGTATHMIVLMSHIVTDAAGAMVMFREVATRETGPVPGLQSLEQARWQASPAGERQNARTLRYWADLLRSVPTRRFPDGLADPQTPRHWTGEFRSPVLRTTVRAIAERTGSDSSAVLMVLFAATLARITGINPVVIRPVVHNRFRSHLVGVMCMVAQAGVCGLDVADVTVDEAVRRAEHATRIAYKHAYFDPEQLNDLIAQVAEERDPDLDLACFLNDRRMDRIEEAPTDPLPDPGEPLPPPVGGTFDWTIKQDDPVERLFLHLDDTPEHILLTVCVDTHFMSPAAAEALVRGMETLAVQAAADPATPTGVVV
jgi:hypothetical protein